MTGVSVTRSGAEETLLRRLASLTRNIPGRTREREFWITQAGVLGVTAIHILSEMWTSGLHDEIPSALHHIPVVMYLAPIAYASLKYGTEGAVLTGLWSALLTVPNLLIWHSEELEWLEIIYVAAVIVAGVAMSIPVERERAQRIRAEATTQRLGLLNKIATLTLTVDLHTTVDETLQQLADMLNFEAVCVALVDVSDHPTVLACHSRAKSFDIELRQRIRQLRCLHDSEKAPDHDPSLTVVPLEANIPGFGPSGRVEGLVAAKHDPYRPPTPNDIRLLEGVASHLAVAIANERLSESERDRLRSYARVMTQAQEDERKRIARELHDEASQNVVVIRRALADISKSLDGHPAATELSELDNLAGETLVGMRRFSRDLRPPTLDQLGLYSALEQLVVEMEERNAVEIDFRAIGAFRRLPIDKELAIFRIGQAALHNVERHADADTVTIELVFEPEKIRLEITDNGRGFEMPESLDRIHKTGKLGVVGMYERAELAGGILEIRSEQDKGTRVSLEVRG